MSTSELGANVVQDSRDVEALIRDYAGSHAENSSRPTDKKVQLLYEWYRKFWLGQVPFLPLSIKDVSSSWSHGFDESIKTPELFQLLREPRQISAREAIGALRALYDRSAKTSPWNGHLPQ